MTFIEFVREKKLSYEEARSCLRFLVFIRAEKQQMILETQLRQEFKQRKKRKG